MSKPTVTLTAKPARNKTMKHSPAPRRTPLSASTANTRGRGRPSRLTRQQILDAGLALLAAHGEKGLSMRKLADEIGVAPMTLYNHISNKEELINLLMEHILDDWQVPSSAIDENWQNITERILQSLRQHLLSHPAMLTAIVNRDRLTVLLFQPLKPLADTLFEAGLQGPALASVLRQLAWFTLGFVSLEARTATDNEESYRQGIDDTVSTSEDKTYQALQGNLDSVKPDELFTEQLRVVLAGISVVYKTKTDQADSSPLHTAFN